jgi:hypothetical protein
MQRDAAQWFSYAMLCNDDDGDERRGVHGRGQGLPIHVCSMKKD